MYATISGRPWMYATTSGRPWMYGRLWMYAKVDNGAPWMYAKTNGRPWMYAVINARPGRTRPREITRHGPVSA
jgi:hypothetical protein